MILFLCLYSLISVMQVQTSNPLIPQHHSKKKSKIAATNKKSKKYKGKGRFVGSRILHFAACLLKSYC